MNNNNYIEEEIKPLNKFVKAYTQPSDDYDYDDDDEYYNNVNYNIYGKHETNYDYKNEVFGRNMNKSNYENNSNNYNRIRGDNNLVCFNIDKITQANQENSRFVEEQGKQMTSLVDIISGYEQENTNLRSKLDHCNTTCKPLNVTGQYVAQRNEGFSTYVYNYNLYYILLAILLFILLIIIIY